METKTGPAITVTLIASSLQEKAAWCSDIAQCIENLHYSEMMNNESSSVVISQAVRSDPRLYRDDVDIKFSRSLNSCKVPQIRHATLNRLLDRLTDLRFMSVDFLNTFLTTYRVFTTSAIIIEALWRILRNPECANLEYQTPKQRHSLDNHHHGTRHHGDEEDAIICSEDYVIKNQQQQRQSCQHFQPLNFNSNNNNAQYFNQQPSFQQQQHLLLQHCCQRVQHSTQQFQQQQQHYNLLRKPNAEKLRRVSTGCMKGEEPKSPLTTRLSEGGRGELCGGACRKQQLVSKEKGSKKCIHKDKTESAATNAKPPPLPLTYSAAVVVTTHTTTNSIATTTSASSTKSTAASTSISSFLLGLPRSKKLAPIASCETLSGSLDLCFPPGEQSHRCSRESLVSLDSQFSPDVQDGDGEDNGEENGDEVYYFPLSSSQPQTSVSSTNVTASSTEDSAFSSETSPMKASVEDDHNQLIHLRVQRSQGSSQDRQLFTHQQHEQVLSTTPGSIITTTNSTLSIPSSISSAVALNLPVISTSATEIEDTSGLPSPMKPTRLRHRSSLTVPVSPHCLTVSPTPSFSSSSETLTGSHQLLTSVDSTDPHTSTSETFAPTSSELTPPLLSTSPVGGQRRSLVSSLFGGFKGKINCSSGNVTTTSSAAIVAGVVTSTSVTSSYHVATAKSPPVSPSLSGASQRRHHLQHHHHHRHHAEADPTTPLEDLPSDEERHRRRRHLFQSPSSLSASSSQRLRSNDEKQIEALALSPATSPKFSRLVLTKTKFSSNKSCNTSQSLLSATTMSNRVKTGSPLPSPSSSSSTGFFQTFRRATSPSTFQFPEDSNQPHRPLPLYQLHQRHQPPAQSQQQLQRQQAVCHLQNPDFCVSACNSCGCVGVARDAGDTAPTSPLLGKVLCKRTSSPISFSYSSLNLILNHNSASCRASNSVLCGKTRLQHSGKHVTYDVELTSSATASSVTSPSAFLSSATSSAFSSSSSASIIPPPPSSSSPSSSSSSKAKAGTVVTSSRASKRRSSSVAATAAFAAATAGSTRHHSTSAESGECRRTKRTSAASPAALLRVLNILRHWVIKHSQDFEHDQELRSNVRDLLEEVMTASNLLPAEHKLASSIMAAILKDGHRSPGSRVHDDQFETLLRPPDTPSRENFDTLGALDIAEQMTLLDHKIFVAIRSEELLGQAWMKVDKAARSPHVLLVSKRFNEASKMVVCEIVSRQTVQERVSCIEKWTAIADICRCLHNFNGVLQICAAFVNSSVYRLRKTWEKIPKQTRQMIDRLQLLVSSDGRFKNMRDALHRCDPPCIPYLGMYLTDLSFIEEGTSNVTEEGLINFSKMRMVAHVIREIQHFQQTPYRIEHQIKTTNYLLDLSRLMEEDQAFCCSLEIEPRTTRSSVSSQAT